MNNKDFTQHVREALGGTATESAAALAIKAVTQALADGLAEEQEVRIRGFGSFRLHRYPARRLPRPGDSELTTHWLRFSFTPARGGILPPRPEDTAPLCPAHKRPTPAPAPTA